jgi:hypothetical protein
MFHLNVQKSGKEDFFLVGKRFPKLQRSDGKHSLNRTASNTHSTAQHQTA